jgi:anti-sigma regulatory factor (Ser/Thr protein kinase)
MFMGLVNFLSIADNSEEIKNQLLRKQAKNILESYNQDWDILSEVFQNAIDAIDQNLNITEGVIKFVFNKNTRQISIWDNGIGISSDELTQILRPSVTYKEGKNNLRGEKGVGLSFLLFSTNNLTIESCKDGKKIVGKVENAFDWVSKKTDEIPQLDLTVDDCEENSLYTKFTLSEVSSIQEELDFSAII